MIKRGDRSGLGAASGNGASVGKIMRQKLNQGDGSEATHQANEQFHRAKLMAPIFPADEGVRTLVLLAEKSDWGNRVMAARSSRKKFCCLL